MNEQHAFYYSRPKAPQKRTNGRYPPLQQPASPHRAGHYAGIHPEDVPYMTTDLEVGEPDEPPYARTHSSVRRYDQLPLTTNGHTQYEPRPVLVHPAVPQRRSAVTTPAIPREEEPATSAPSRVRRFRFHPLVYLGVGMVLMFSLWVCASFALSWYSTWQDDLHYGRPRTAQYDVVVGHGDSPAHPTHFIALNLTAQIVLVEIPGGNLSQSRTYQGPTLYGPDANLAPITLTFEDVNHDGKVDMLVHFQGSEIIYLNQNGKFVPQH
jgi:hypothetical protein